ncbi:FeoB-associated Cys-rich membrane protein [Dysosmobacter sp. HCP28S3_G4]
MTIIDIILLLLIAFCVGLSLQAIRKGRTGGCSGDCANCSGCGKRDKRK